MGGEGGGLLLSSIVAVGGVGSPAAPPVEAATTAGAEAFGRWGFKDCAFVVVPPARSGAVAELPAVTMCGSRYSICGQWRTHSQCLFCMANTAG